MKEAWSKGVHSIYKKLRYYHLSYRVATEFQVMHRKHKQSSFLPPSLPLSRHSLPAPLQLKLLCSMTFLKRLNKNVPINVVEYVVEAPEVKGLSKWGEGPQVLKQPQRQYFIHKIGEARSCKRWSPGPSDSPKSMTTTVLK